ncbi:MAG: phage terminase small subunit [Rheinheimera aquimaris]|jgi:phage terminase small subunit|tara:strand:- start:366 stop:602 length:237 start_codon:yes stop_codon:yes gene_type:complete
MFTHIPYPEMGVSDCTRYLKCTSACEYYIKQGMHGSNGNWKREDKEVAIQWLLDAAVNNVRVLGSHSGCQYIVAANSV